MSEQSQQLRLHAIPMIYESNPKHSQPWQRGARGSLCPRGIRRADAQQLLDESVPDAGSDKRYATDGAFAYCAQLHLPDRWHGYPVTWGDVPLAIRRQWMNAGKVTRRIIKRNWSGPDA